MTAVKSKTNRTKKIAGDGAESLPRLPYEDPIKGEMDLRDDERRIVSERSTLIALDELERHPQNRRPSQASIDERAKSLAADGQLQDVEVRKNPDAKRGGYQIISGETRVLAAKKLGWKAIRCTVVECDDAEALRLVALHNGQRADLNPIEKAELVESLCKPVDEGGAAQTREEAGRAVGLGSGSAASNLVRLLKLPKAWKDRVAAGELPESFARLLVPVAHIPPIMDELDKDWRSKNDWDREQFQSRELLEDAVENLVRQTTRRFDEKYWYSSFGQHPCLLSKDEIEANRKALAIVTLTVAEGKGKTKDVEVATNAQLFDELQTAILQRRADKKAAKKSGAVGGEAKERPKSKAELAAAAEMRKEQLFDAIERWQERVLRKEIAAAIITAKAKLDLRVLKLIAHFAAAGFGVATWNVDTDSALEEFTQVKAADSFGARGAYLQLSAATVNAKNPTIAWHSIAAEFCAWLLLGDGKFDGAGLSREILDSLYAEGGGDWAATWSRLYVANDAAISDFLQLHRKDELESLGEEWGVHLAGKEKKAMVALLLGRPSPLKLPKCLQPAKPRGKKG